MRRTPLLLASAALPLVLVAGCGGSSKPAAGPSAAAGGLPTVTGAFNASPTIAIPSGNPGTALVSKELSTGTGPAVVEGQSVVFNYTAETYAEKKVFGSSFGHTPIILPVAKGKILDGLDEGLVGKKIGSRVLLVIPPDKGYGTSGSSQAGIKGTDVLVFVVDLLGAYKATADSSAGTVQKAPAGEPTVSAPDGAKPVVKIPKTPAPKTLVSTVLVKGSGPLTKKGQYLVTQYLGEVYATGKEFDSSWSRAAPAGFPIGTGQVIPGWDKALVGVPIGSRVLLVVPPAEGYGAAGNTGAGIKATDTMVFVVDILGAY